ncbi:unnamed protein product [Caenorhabditis angaria]|uniref:Ubiquitin carboxyl-terminal hydrolase n=1 Tax=Caenorhabditis angaria TaxID=860376 RepID=A0A9P1I9M3_9PELO|nr:unnamed protein product [Caenorhabditis angaria]
MVVENDVTSSPQKKLVRMQQGRGLPGGEKEDENASGRSNPVFASASATFPSSSSAAGNANSYSYGYPIDENDHRYVGLVNQAMTCYLNSLVQSLYMTPEFRNAMYEWEYISSGKNIAQKKGESSIPCQLQKLFLLLQTTDNESLETRDLTQSFGWSASEAYDQHDVQELCRLMFDALEHKWKGTKHEKLIQDLYRGTMEDVVKCLACGKENVRTDYFLDLPLAVKPFGATTAFKSVQEALHAFIQPELLDGSNQYMCENCKSKQDAHKGLRITQFPYLLTIQLKRFDFDYNTMHRIKLNDRMTFPDVLDLNDYIYPPEGNGGEEEKKSEGISIGGNQEEETMEFGSPPSKAHKPEAESPEFEQDENVYEYHENSAVRVGQRIDQKSVDELLQKGENVYELFSVMVHSGSAAGGHYYAYIKNLEQDKWYSFNDTRVDFANVAEIERSFGGHSGGWNASNTNAYMLMYRKIDRKRNCVFLHTDKLPAHIQLKISIFKLKIGHFSPMLAQNAPILAQNS